MKSKFFFIGALLILLLAIGVTWVSAQGIDEYGLFTLVCVKGDGSMKVVSDFADCKDKELHGALVNYGQFLVMAGKITNLETQVDSLEADSGELQTQIDGLQAQIDSLEAQASGLQTQVNVLQGDLDAETADRLAADNSLEGRLVAIEDYLTGGVVRLYTIDGSAGHVQPNQKLFHTVLCNPGDVVISGDYFVLTDPPTSHAEATKITALGSYPWGFDSGQPVMWRYDFYNTHSEAITVITRVTCADITP